MKYRTWCVIFTVIGIGLFATTLHAYFSGYSIYAAIGVALLIIDLVYINELGKMSELYDN